MKNVNEKFVVRIHICSSEVIKKGYSEDDKGFYSSGPYIIFRGTYTECVNYLKIQALCAALNMIDISKNSDDFGIKFREDHKLEFNSICRRCNGFSVYTYTYFEVERYRSCMD